MSYVVKYCIILDHDDVTKWKHFPRYWPFVRGIQRSPVICPHKGKWLGALMFSFICAWINGWANNFEAGNLRRHRAHYDVIVMMQRMRAQSERWHSSVLKKVSIIELSMKTSVVSLNEGPSYFPRRAPRYTQTCASLGHMPLGCWTLRLRSARVAIWWEYFTDDFSLCCEMYHTVMKSECLW